MIPRITPGFRRFIAALCHDESGQVGGVETLAVGTLIFVSGMLLAVNAWAVVDARLMVGVAAREAVRAAVEADSASEAYSAADDAARRVTTSYHRDPDRLDIDSTHLAGGTFQRCALVQITTRYEVPAITIPWTGGFGRGFNVKATRGGLVDPFRSGDLGGSCA